MAEKKIYYSFLHDKDTAVKDETYYDPEVFEWSALLERDYPIYKTEVFKLIDKHQSKLKPYFAESMVNGPEKWKGLSFYFWGLPMSKDAIVSCPETIKSLQKIPNLVSASISIMEPGTEIKPHYGDTDAIYRVHVPLKVPAKLPECGFRVGYEDRSWEEGKLLIFNDAAYHKAWNLTSERRVILLLDVLKPEHSSCKKWILAKVRGSIIWMMFTQVTGILKERKNVITKTASIILALFTYLFVFPFSLKSSLLK